MSWRDGVHIGGTQIWCDALRAREICFVSRADEMASTRHGQLVATGETLALLDSGQRTRRPETELAVPYGRPFTLGTRRIELLRAGHSIGAASMLVDLGGVRVLYAGAVNRRGGGLGGIADLRPCDVVVLSTGRAAPGVRFASAEEMAARTVEHTRAITARGGVAVLLVSSAGRAMDLAAHLDGVALAAHRSIHLAAQRLRRSGTLLPAMRRVAAGELASAAGRALLWPVSAREHLVDADLPASSAVALVSGAAADPRQVALARADHGIPWSGSADRADVAAYIADSGAREAYLTGRFAEDLALELDSAARPVRPIGPPVQMSLFG